MFQKTSVFQQSVCYLSIRYCNRLTFFRPTDRVHEKKLINKVTLNLTLNCPFLYMYKEVKSNRLGES